MPSNINIQLAEFQQFVQFAETAIAAGKQKAIVRDEEDAQFRRFGVNGPGFMSV
jgi:hypothetical protein